MDEDDRFTRITLRIPKALHQQLSEAVAGRATSQNAEIVARLERSFEGEKLGFSGDLIDVLSLHAMLTSAFAKLVDRSKLSEQENEMLMRLEGVADRVVSRTCFAKTGPHTAAVTGSAKTAADM